MNDDSRATGIFVAEKYLRKCAYRKRQKKCRSNCWKMTVVVIGMWVCAYTRFWPPMVFWSLMIFAGMGVHGDDRAALSKLED